MIALTNQQWDILSSKLDKIIDNTPSRRKLDDKLMAEIVRLRAEVSELKEKLQSS